MAESNYCAPNGYEFKFSDKDIINKDEFIPTGESNPHKIRPWLLHDHGFTVAVVFASCEQDVLDIACDEGKLERYLISESEMKDYEDEEGITYLGNAGEPHDIESLGMVELPNPKFSFCAMFNAM
jgi:hypothetical protein